MGAVGGGFFRLKVDGHSGRGFTSPMNYIEAVPVAATVTLADDTAAPISAVDLWVLLFAISAPAATGTVTWGDATTQKNPLNHFFPSLDPAGRVRYNLKNVYVKTTNGGGDPVEVNYVTLAEHY
jgi:hypothetical protein